MSTPARGETPALLARCAWVLLRSPGGERSAREAKSASAHARGLEQSGTAAAAMTSLPKTKDVLTSEFAISLRVGSGVKSLRPSGEDSFDTAAARTITRVLLCVVVLARA